LENGKSSIITLKYQMILLSLDLEYQGREKENTDLIMYVLKN
jgi:hypothetical protein